ncbi:MAG: tRNA adenosine(34) deaminase TadA [Clostridia bacterium]|nr:tRNA adenosine(34) deaminase TadA [Clostridia bacterium]
MAYNETFMREALKQAKKAKKINEAPIGAVIVRDNKIISRGYNKRETKKNGLYHAEIIAIDKACKKLSGWRLPGCDIYITLEPCPMCAGAIIQTRIENVYFGAYDQKSGCGGSVFNMFEDVVFNHKPNISGGHMQCECSQILSDFFKTLRETRRNKK